MSVQSRARQSLVLSARIIMAGLFALTGLSWVGYGLQPTPGLLSTAILLSGVCILLLGIGWVVNR